jgi:hypothetical protein
MATETEHSERDRWQVMKVMRAEGKEFAEMVPALIDLGLLECRTGHRTRVTGKGATVCATCEGTISQDWRRGLARLTEQEADALAVKGAWIEAHEFIRDTCRKKAVTLARKTVTRTEGEAKITTVTEWWQINNGLLRLMADVSDKLARVAGVTVDAVAPQPVVPVDLHFHERDDDSSAGDIAN